MISELNSRLLGAVQSASSVEELPHDSYTDMAFPSLLKLMKFRTDRYKVENFGHLMVMHTTTKMGMELLTLSFMPSGGLTVPYLLVDAMEMKQKRCVFVEYYGCGMEGLESSRLEELYESQRLLPDYAEKPNWYVGERESYSLIKTGTEQQLVNMAVTSVEMYMAGLQDAHVDPAYRERLSAFRQRMIDEGNPSSSTLHLLLGKKGVEEFMKRVVMPLDGEPTEAPYEKRGSKWLV